jgi:hypothetical protein
MHNTLRNKNNFLNKRISGNKKLFKTISHNALANSLFNDGVISNYFSTTNLDE